MIGNFTRNMDLESEFQNDCIDCIVFTLNKCSTVTKQGQGQINKS